MKKISTLAIAMALFLLCKNADGQNATLGQLDKLQVSELKNEQANGVKILELEKENAELKRKYDSVIKLAQIPKEQKHRVPYHKNDKINYDVVHLKPNEWSAPFIDRSEIFYSYLTDDTLGVDMKVTLSSGKVIYVENLNQNKIFPQSVYDDENPIYEWQAKKEVDIVIMQCTRKAYNNELHRMAKKGYFKTPDSNFWYMNPQSPKVTKN